MSHRNEQGFILPLSVLLVIILAISGTSFMQHDYLERRMGSNTVDNYSAFYLATAGLERARAVFEIGSDEEGALTWTPVLQPADLTLIDSDLLDPLHQLLCGAEPCIIPAFGSIVNAPDVPFDGTFSRGQYAVRAFDNFEAAEGNEEDQNWSEDSDQRLTLRAVGTIGNEQKVLESTIFASVGLRMINCDENFDNNDPDPAKRCPNSPQPIPITWGPPLQDRDPHSFPPEELPVFQPNFYNNWRSFPPSWGFASNHIEITPVGGGLVEFKSIPFPDPLNNKYPLISDTHYFIDGDVMIKASANNIVVFATGALTIDGVLNSRESILIGQNGIVVQGAGTIEGPPPFPVMISGNNGIEVDGAMTIEGNIWSFGDIDINATTIRGTITGVNGEIRVKVASTMEDHPDDSLDPIYYEPMPGFSYPEGQGSPGIVAGTWRELE